MSGQDEPQNEELEDQHGEVLVDRKAMSALARKLRDPAVGPDELPPIKEP